MGTDITLFAQPQIAPVYLQNNAVAKALQEQLEGGLAGRQINRISLRNGKFRFIKAGTEIAAIPGPLPVVIVAANPAVGRLFWIKGFDPDETTRPDCYSRDGIKPEADSPAVQSTHCATCPKNAKGSGNDGKSKACSYKKRVILVDPRNIMGDAYALDEGAMSMFGDDAVSQRLFNLKSYIEALKSNGLIVPAVVTQLSFDDEATVPKLLHTPVRVLTEAEFRQVESRLNDPAVREMLDDIDYKSEEGKPVPAPAPVQQAAAPTAPAVQQAPAAAAPTSPPVATTPAASGRRGRPPRAETPPAQAPAPQAAPAGFPTGGNGAAAPAQAPAPQAPAGFPAAAPAPAAQAAAPTGVPGFTIDLNEFDA